MKKYGIKSGAFVKTSAQTIGSVCEQLERMNKLTPANLVEVSRSIDAPLHDEFEWNDTIAGEKYREHQARYLIRVITIEPDKKESEPIRAFVSIPQQNRERKYINTQYAMSIPKTREVVLADAIRELNAFRRKFNALNELAGVFAEINKLNVA